MRQLLYTMFISNSRALFYLCWKESLVKRQKVSKFYKNDCKRPYFDTRGRQTCFTKLVLAWNFLILIEYSNTEGPSLVAVRMEYLFSYQFWYLELWVGNLSGGEAKHYSVNFSCRGAFNVDGWGFVRLALCTSLQLQIPCTYSLPTLHIYSAYNGRCIWNPVEHLRCSFFAEIVKAVGYFRRRAPSCISNKMFDKILNATLPNNLL